MKLGDLLTISNDLNVKIEHYDIQFHDINGNPLDISITDPDITLHHQQKVVLTLDGPSMDEFLSQKTKIAELEKRVEFLDNSIQIAFDALN